LVVKDEFHSSAERLLEASLNLQNIQRMYMFLMLDIKGMNDIRLISRPIHAPNHELEDTVNNKLPTKVISIRIFVELLGIREESVILYLWGMNSLA